MKLFKAEIKGSVELAIEQNFFKFIKESNIWFTNQKFTTPILFVLLTTDGLGFAQIAKLTMSSDALSRTIIILAFLIAFELAPLYIGYSICLKSYCLGKRIHNWVFWFSLFAFVLGFVANFLYRILTMKIAYNDPTIAKAMTIVMIILPLVTSLVSLVIGCLSFNPLLDDMRRFSKKLCALRRKRRQVIAAIDEYCEDTELKNKMLSDDDENYEKAKLEVVAISQRLSDYVYAKETSYYNRSKII